MRLTVLVLSEIDQQLLEGFQKFGVNYHGVQILMIWVMI